MPLEQPRRSFARHVLTTLLALPLGIVGCGGGDAAESPAPQPHQVGGSIGGLTGSGLVLSNGSDSLAVAAGATQFTMTTAVAAGAAYAVDVEAQPTGQTCAVTQGAGTMPDRDVTDVAVTCTVNRHAIGGSISGLSTGGLALSNGDDTVIVSGGATDFTMSSLVAYGTGYGVTVQTQPEGLTCSVADGSGTMGDADVTSVAVTCAPASFTLGGTITDLTAAGLVLANGSDTLAVDAGATSFTLAQPVAFGGAYAVTVQTQPVGATCSVTGGTGTMGSEAVSDIDVTCVTIRATVGGTVADLVDAGLVLANGSDTVAVPAYATSFALPQAVAYGGSYAVTVHTQPTGANCSVTSASGTMGSDAVTNVSVSCVELVPTVTTFAGSGAFGHADGNAADAEFARPGGAAFDGAGNLYVADYFNHVIRKITPSGTVSTVAGIVGGGAYIDGNGSAAAFFGPIDVAVDGAGNVYVADYGNHAIRKITPAGDVTTLAGTGSPGGVDATGTAASFFGPFGVAVDAAGQVYVADSGNNKIRRISPAGEVVTVAGSGTYGMADGSGNAATFGMPVGVAVDSAGNLLVTDHGTGLVRRVGANGEVTTLAGSGSAGLVDGVGAAASFNLPFGVAIDRAGNAYVADHGNHAIRKITTSGRVTTIAGGAQGSADGVGTAAQFYYPVGVAIDATGNLFVGDYGNQKIRKVSPGVN